MATQAEKDQYLGLVATGWVLVLYLPLAGLVISFLLMGRREGHALAIGAVAIVSIAAQVFAYVFLFA